jgi:hypothetical protein
MVQLSAARCSCIAILWVSLLSFAAITLCVASQWVIPKVSVYFVINLVWKLLKTLSYVLPTAWQTKFHTHTKTGKITISYIIIFKFLGRRHCVNIYLWGDRTSQAVWGREREWLNREKKFYFIQVCIFWYFRNRFHGVIKVGNHWSRYN